MKTRSQIIKSWVLLILCTAFFAFAVSIASAQQAASPQSAPKPPTQESIFADCRIDMANLTYFRDLSQFQQRQIDQLQSRLDIANKRLQQLESKSGGEESPK